MDTRIRLAASVVTGLLASACATLPAGPSVMALPGSTKTFDEFQQDDAVCRDWASYRTGTTPQRAAADDAVASAAIGAGLGAAAGAAIGAAAGDPGTGAAVGAGSGLLFGSAVGAERSVWTGAEVQRRYDAAYIQCMYAKDNQVPMAAGAAPRSAPPRPVAARRPPSRRIPPPPPGPPPPPPPDA